MYDLSCMKLKNKTRTTLRINDDYWEKENVAGKGRCIWMTQSKL